MTDFNPHKLFGFEYASPEWNMAAKIYRHCEAEFAEQIEALQHENRNLKVAARLLQDEVDRLKSADSPDVAAKKAALLARIRAVNPEAADWLESAECESIAGVIDLDWDTSSMLELMIWRNTPQGSDYWGYIYDQIIELKHHPRSRPGDRAEFHSVSV